MHKKNMLLIFKFITMQEKSSWEKKKKKPISSNKISVGCMTNWSVHACKIRLKFYTLFFVIIGIYVFARLNIYKLFFQKLSFASTFRTLVISDIASWFYLVLHLLCDIPINSIIIWKKKKIVLESYFFFNHCYIVVIL